MTSNSATDLQIEAQLRTLFADALGLGARAQHLTRQTALFGSLPELDSMAVATLLAGIEEQFNIFIDDEDVSADLFETFGSLADFIAAKAMA